MSYEAPIKKNVMMINNVLSFTIGSVKKSTYVQYC